MEVIEHKVLSGWLSVHPSWVLCDEEIVFERKFSNFVESFEFLSRLAILMEKHNHHPTIMNSYDNVRLSMNTHDAGNKITDRDLKLAEAIEELL